eukprot:6204406-Pleurochrysis_carterae.AAC.3
MIQKRGNSSGRHEATGSALDTQGDARTDRPGLFVAGSAAFKIRNNADVALAGAILIHETHAIREERLSA